MCGVTAHSRSDLVLLALPLLLACRAAPAPQGDSQKPLIVSDRGGAVRVYEIDDAAGLARLIGSPRADDASYQDSMPARLSDGRVLLVSDRGGRPAIHLVSPDEAGANPLLPPSPAADSDPAPLGRDRVLFSRAESAGGRDLYSVRLDGTGLLRLTRHPGDDAAPCATPDGRTVVFVSDRDEAPRLYRLSPEAADPESTVAPVWPPLPRSSAPMDPQDAGQADGAPACLPGGSIAFSRGPRGGPTYIYIANLASGRNGVRQLTDPLVLPHGAAEPVPLVNGGLLITGGPVPLPEEGGGGQRFAVYTITTGGYNLTRVTREGAAYNDFARRLQPPR